ncbi:MAG: hypothetical protein R2911_23505 [Caldilineaceae bacterium]
MTTHSTPPTPLLNTSDKSIRITGVRVHKLRAADTPLWLVAELDIRARSHAGRGVHGLRHHRLGRWGSGRTALAASPLNFCWGAPL